MSEDDNNDAPDEERDPAVLMLELLRQDQLRRSARMAASQRTQRRSIGDGSYPGRALGGGTAIVISPSRGGR